MSNVQRIASFLAAVLSTSGSLKAFSQDEKNNEQTPQTSEGTASDSFAAKPKAAPAEDKVIPEKTIENRVKTERKEKKDYDRSRQSGTGFGVFGGADLGIIFTSPTGDLYPKLESSQLGFTPTAKILGSVFTRRIVLDLGLGLQYALYSGERIGQIVVKQDEDGNEFPFPEPIKEPYSFSQTTMVIEGAARLKFKQNFQAGLLGTALFSNSSAGFTSLRPGEDVNSEPYTVFIGPQFIYEKPFQKYISRIGASFSVSLTGSNRTAYLANLHAGIGSFLSEGATIVRTQRETKVKTKIVKEVISMKAQTAEVTDNVSFIFDSQMVNFKLNSSELSEKSAAFLSALGEVFAKEKDIWDKLIIEGHTDTRGSANFNQKLSALRAKTVAKELEKAGVPASALVATGLGASKPLISNEKSEVDFARNRRVEIRILGLKDARRLQKSVDEVQAQFFGKSIPRVPIPQSTPETSNPPEPQEPVWDPGIDTPGGN